MRSYLLSTLAENNTDDIVSYIANENKKAAFELLDALYQAMDGNATKELLSLL